MIDALKTLTKGLMAKINSIDWYTLKHKPFSDTGVIDQDALPESLRIGETAVVLYNSSLTLESRNESVYHTDWMSAFSLEGGSEYTIIWEGVEYKCTARLIDIPSEFVTYVELGNLSIQTGDTEDDTGEPFYIYGDISLGGGAGTGEFNILTFTPSVSNMTIIGTTVKKLDSKYLDYTWKGLPDKPFGKVIGSSVIVPSSTIEGFSYTSEDVGKSAYVVRIDTAPFIPEIGQTYLITWDGKKYECPCGVVNEEYDDRVIGDPSFWFDNVSGKPDPSIPFMIGMFNDGTNVLIATTDTGSSHTVEISIAEVEKLNISFLPIPEIAEAVLSSIPSAEEASF